MRNLLLRTMLLVVPMTLAVLVVGIPTAASDDLQNVTLTCSDGTNLALTLDSASLTQLTDAVDAINLNPAGDPPLTCSVLNGPLLQSTSTGSRQLARWSSPTRKAPSRALREALRMLSAGSPTYDYAVGGGRAPNLGCPIIEAPFSPPFALNAHVVHGAPAGTASGTFNVGSPAPNVFCDGHFTSKVDCLVVTATMAHLTAHVTQATGVFAGLQNTEIDVAVQDNGPPSSMVFDMIDDGNTTATCAQGLDFAGGPTEPDQPVTNGNVTVHGAI